MRFGIALPQFVSDGEFDPLFFRRFLARAEELGFESGWTQEQTLGSNPVLNPLGTLTFAAACTSRLRLGCAVFVTPLHQPVQLATALATLDQLSRGRLEIGVGFGGRFRIFGAFAIDPEHLVTRFREGIELMCALLSGEAVTYSGRYYSAGNIRIAPASFQKPHPPLWFGGSNPAALRRAVLLGDGFIGAGSQTTERFAYQVATVRAELARVGRSAGTFRIAKRVYVAVDDDASRARQRVNAALGRLYSEFNLPDLDAVAVCGSPADVVRGIEEVGAKGAELVVLNPLFDEGRQLERLAGEVIPAIA